MKVFKFTLCSLKRTYQSIREATYMPSLVGGTVCTQNCRWLERKPAKRKKNLKISLEQ